MSGFAVFGTRFGVKVVARASIMVASHASRYEARQSRGMQLGPKSYSAAAGTRFARGWHSWLYDAATRDAAGLLASRQNFTFDRQDETGGESPNMTTCLQFV